MKNLILSIFIIGCLFSVYGQREENIKDFDYLVQKIKEDYPGYSIKVTSETSPQLLKLEQDIRKKINLYPDSTYRYLKQYASWFKDHHLRVSSSINSPLHQKKDVVPPYCNINIDSLKEKAKLTSVKTIEGIWHCFRGDIAIVRNNNTKSYQGIAISYNGFEKNQIVFQFDSTEENEFKVDCYSNKYNTLKSLASLKLNNQVLEIHDDTRFVRQSNSGIYDNALLYSYNAEFPNGRNTYAVAINLTDSTFYLRIPSFSSNVAEQLVKKHWSDILVRPDLIIDVRNNGGGQDGFYQVLSKLVYTQPYISKGVEWYATKNNIKFFEDAIKNKQIKDGEEGLKFTNSLINEMKKHTGNYVIHPMMGSERMARYDTVYPYPKRVGIIINEGNASSTEQFLLGAKNSRKVTLFGNCNTAGVLDYSNAVSVNFPSNRYELIYPMTRSRRLPAYPIDNIGIAPDIIIPYPETNQLYDRLDQWVYFVKDYLEQIAVKKQ